MKRKKLKTRAERIHEDEQKAFTLIVFSLSLFILWVWAFYGSPHNWKW